MDTQLAAQWPWLRRWWRKSLPMYAFATRNPDGSPHVTPIGSVLLNDDGTGFYFEIFTQQLVRNVEADPRFAIMALRISPWLWLRALLTGRFQELPALRILGHAGPRREATGKERQRWHRRVGPLRHLRGGKLLWGHLDYVREIRIERIEPVQLGAMTQGLWPPQGSGKRL